MGVDHGGTGGTSPPPEFGAGDANTNCPPRFCHIGTKMSVLWPSKYAKISFRPALRPGPRWGSSWCSPRPLSRLERGHPSPYATPLDTDPSSALAMSPPLRSPARSTPMIQWPPCEHAVSLTVTVCDCENDPRNSAAWKNAKTFCSLKCYFYLSITCLI